MNKLCSRLFLAVVCVLLSVFDADGAVYSYRVGVGSPLFVDGGDGMTQSLGGVDWTCAYERGSVFSRFFCYAPVDDSKADWGYEFGSAGNNMKRLALTSDVFRGRVSRVAVVSAAGRGSLFDLTVTVGGVKYAMTSSCEAAGFAYNRWAYVFEGEASGQIVLEWANSQTCYRVNMIEVETEPVGICAAPEIMPDAGVITARTGVSMACVTPGARISYCIDGGKPLVYDGPFLLPLGNGHEVSAYAEADGSSASEVIVRTFDVVPHDGDYGSAERPFNVDAANELMRQCPSALVWVKGYIVGSMSGSGASFSSGGLDGQSDIVLAQEIYVNSLPLCVVVRQQTSSVPMNLSAGCYGETAYVHGVLSREGGVTVLSDVDAFGLPYNAGVADMVMDSFCEDEVVYFSLTGQLINPSVMSPGCYIRRQGSSATKIYVR